MRILLITPYYIPAWGFGGPVKVVSDVAQELVKRGHTVTVATTDVLDGKKRIEKSEDLIDGCKVFYFPNLSSHLAFRWNVYLPRGFAAWLRKHIREFDVIHCHDYYSGMNATVSHIAPEFGVPYIVQPHGALIPVRVKARFSFLKRLWLWRNRKVATNAAYIFPSTEKEREEILLTLKLPPERVVVVPNGLGASAIVELSPDLQRRASLHLASDDFVILYFGRIQFIKGVDISIEALAKIPEIPWKFIIVGRDDGQLAQLLSVAAQLGIGERVIFVGPQFGQELESIMSISDIFLFNSRSESFPIAVLNACAAGLPMILSPECRVPEVGEYGAGVVLSENTPAATAKAIQDVFTNVDQRKKMAGAGKRLVQEKFTLERVVDQLVQLYTQMAASLYERTKVR